MVSTVICVGHADHVACRVEKGSQDVGDLTVSLLSWWL